MKIDRNCNECGDQYQAETRYLNRGQGIYCSRSCFGKANGKRLTKERLPNVTCSYCNVEFYKKTNTLGGSKSGLFFCSRAHKDAAQRLGGIKEIMPPHYGVSNALIPEYRRKAFEHYPNKCAHCGWNEYPDVLEVNHKNIDRSDNSIENLEILCPTCHQIFHYLTKTGRYGPRKKVDPEIIEISASNLARVV